MSNTVCHKKINVIEHSIIECVADVFLFQTEHIIPSNFYFSKLAVLTLILIIISDCKFYSFHRKQDKDDSVTCPVSRKVHLSTWWLCHVYDMTLFSSKNAQISNVNLLINDADSLSRSWQLSELVEFWIHFSDLDSSQSSLISVFYFGYWQLS